MNILKPFVGLFNLFGWQKYGAHDSTLLIWRKRIFTTIFLCAALTGTFAYIPNIKHTIQKEQWLIAFVYTLAYLVLLTIVTAPAIPFKVRAWAGLLICFFGVGLTALLALGPVGSGRMFLFAFTLLATLLLGLRAGIFALILNVGTFLTIGWLLSEGQLALATFDRLHLGKMGDYRLYFLFFQHRRYGFHWCACQCNGKKPPKGAVFRKRTQIIK